MWIRASQAEICYWAPYSLCGTKRMRKVLKSPKTMTLTTGLTAPPPPAATPALTDTLARRDVQHFDLVAIRPHKRSGSQSDRESAAALENGSTVAARCLRPRRRTNLSPTGATG
ncbi:hypothetical protein SSP531S_50670 [Streptomyces spongiicola]|uniref:Uncharacterized protein n=1 Tax=Streptomyces spongiicola TaxID=1690221 RepID=A0A388T5W0_9ACTN|nr:hypothetical protein SSP531S_50670 [Streptomyces spongiicola]